MILLSLLASTATAGVVPPRAAPAQAMSVTSTVKPALNPWATQFDIASKATGRTYRIYVARLTGVPPKDGWPIVYVLDADITFATVASQNMLHAAYGDSGALIVGIGYPDAASAFSMRNRDLTPSPPNAEGRKLGLLDKENANDFGGSAEFHRFMTTELKPIIAASFPINEACQTLMGYSYGGLFVLNILFTDPRAYRSYVIGSPSIWWNDGEVLAKERSFAKLVRSGEISPRILISSDELEQDPAALKLPTDPAQRALTIDAVENEKMVDNARQLAGRLQALPGKNGYRVEYVVFKGETHMSGIPAASSRGYGFAVKPE